MQPTSIKFNWQERHYKAVITLADIRSVSEENHNSEGQSVKDWAETAQVGDTWQAATGRYPGTAPGTFTRIK